MSELRKTFEKFGILIKALPLNSASGFAVMKSKTETHKYGYLEPNVNVSKSEFVANWNDPEKLLTQYDTDTFYQTHKKHLEESSRNEILYYNNIGARYLGIDESMLRENKLFVMLGTSSFVSYVASNFSKVKEPASTPPKKSKLANLLGFHCLLHNGRTAFLVKRGSTAINSQIWSSSANGGIRVQNSSQDFLVVDSILAEIKNETGVTVNPQAITWLGLGVSKENNQPSLYCSCKIEMSEQRMIDSYINARDSFEVSRSSKGRIAKPEIEQISLKTHADLKNFQVLGWNFPVPLKISFHNLEKRTVNLLKDDNVHPHAKALLILFSRNLLTENRFQSIIQEI